MPCRLRFWHFFTFSMGLYNKGAAYHFQPATVELNMHLVHPSAQFVRYILH